MQCLATAGSPPLYAPAPHLRGSDQPTTVGRTPVPTLGVALGGMQSTCVQSQWQTHIHVHGTSCIQEGGQPAHPSCHCFQGPPPTIPHDGGLPATPTPLLPQPPAHVMSARHGAPPTATHDVAAGGPWRHAHAHWRHADPKENNAVAAATTCRPHIVATTSDLLYAPLPCRRACAWG